MKTIQKQLIIIVLCFFTSSLTAQENNTQNSVAGKWVRMSQTGPVALEFKNNEKVEVDFNADQTIDVVTEYEIDNNIISFIDVYIKYNPSDARAYINRAGTRFPTDMEGAVNDCNKAIALEPENKNAYFLRGLAEYELGEKRKACEDFSRAIELGFSILRIAEQQRCSEYWD